MVPGLHNLTALCTSPWASILKATEERRHFWARTGIGGFSVTAGIPRIQPLKGAGSLWSTGSQRVLLGYRQHQHHLRPSAKCTPLLTNVPGIVLGVSWVRRTPVSVGMVFSQRIEFTVCLRWWGSQGERTFGKETAFEVTEKNLKAAF